MGKIYDFFSGSNKNGKGITKKQVEFDKKLGFGFFFRLLKMRLGKFSGTNLIFSLCNIFIFVALFGISGIIDGTIDAASNPLYPQVSNAFLNNPNPVTASLYSVFGASVNIRVVSDMSKALIASVVLLIFTFGLSTIGMVYNMRNVCIGEYVDTWHDFFYAIKKNFKQGIIIGIADVLVIFLLVYDLLAYSTATSEFVFSMFYYAILLFCAVYYIMRFYIYIQLVTCEMKIGKIIKNSLILVALGLKRNLVGLLSAIVFVFLMLYAFILLPQFSILLMCMFAFAFLTYIGVYCAFPIVKRYVIDPYYDEHPEERPEDPWSTDEKVFVDRG